MSEQNAKRLEALPFSEDYQAQLRAWRRDRYLQLGFNEIQAGSLARKDELDHHRVAHAVREGCPVDLAWDIFI